MKIDKVLTGLYSMKKSLEEVPDESRDQEFYKKYCTIVGAEEVIDYLKGEKSDCLNCGEPLVCPKCVPVIEKTNSIIIRFKDTDYNGGFPNALVITPLYIKPEGIHISCATITGDNFYHPGNKTAGYTYMERGSIEQTARTLANVSLETWCKLFGFPQNRIPMAKDIQIQLVKYLELEEQK